MPKLVPWLAAAWLAATQTSPASWLAVWLGDAVLAVSIGLVAMQRKAQRVGAALTSGPGARFAGTFLPAILAGGILSVVLYNAGRQHYNGGDTNQANYTMDGFNLYDPVTGPLE